MKRDNDGKLKSITLLKLKLALEPEQAAELMRIAELCRRGRNAGSMNWLLRQNGFPESEKQANRVCKHAKYADKPKSESSRIYHAVREASAGLTGTMHSMLASQIESYLSGKLDWREGKTEDGKRPRRRDAVLAYKARPPYFTAIEIPVRAKEAKLVYGDVPSMECRISAGMVSTFKLRTASLSAGLRKILQGLSAGEIKLADSRILQRDDEWFWFLPVAFESNPIVNERTAVLWPTLECDEEQWKREYPLRLVLPDKPKAWGVGDGRYVLAQTHRILVMRKAVGWRYRQRNGAGHGRSKVDGKMRKIAELHGNITDEFRRRMIIDIVRQCERAGCGTLLYREPSLPLRERCWFAKRGLDWNWTRFIGDLENSLKRRGIVLAKEQFKLKDAPNGKQDAA